MTTACPEARKYMCGNNKRSSDRVCVLERGYLHGFITYCRETAASLEGLGVLAAVQDGRL